MQSSNHIGKIVRQHADAVESGKSSARKRKGKGGSSNPFNTVPKHRAFVPMLTIWGGLFLALITAVLPDQAIARASSLTGVYLPLIITRLILATCIGLGGALLGFIVASAMSNRARMVDGDGVLVSTFKSRDVQPINPATELGSESLDAPIEEPAEFFAAEPPEALEEARDSLADEHAPNLGDLARRGYDIDPPEDFEDEDTDSSKGEWAFTRKHFKDALIDSCEGATCEASTGWEKTPDPQPRVQESAPKLSERPEPQAGFAPLTADRVKPRSLDLGEFGALPGRNAVWVEEQDQSQPIQSAPEPRSVPAPKSVPANALEKLRQTPASDLSLVEMVERFAAALHDHQAQERIRAAEGHVARETALAEALKALSLFTEAGFDQGNQMRVQESQIGQTEGELRRALERLQQMRGAA